MVHNWKLASAGTSLVLAVAALGVYAYSRVRFSQTYLLANGVQVTPIEVKADDTQQLLDVKLWKFDVYLPNPEKGDTVVLNLYQHGKFVKSLAGGGFGPTRNPSHHLLVTVGLVPSVGDFSKPGQVKWLIRQNFGATSGAFGTPFQASKSLSCNTQVEEADNLIYLMNGTDGGVRHGDVREDGTALALSVSNTF